ncbi:MAG: cyclic nucleotide-binding/CBS domain-containing protein [Candidatus Geothermarchaeales archaeon]
MCKSVLTTEASSSVKEVARVMGKEHAGSLVVTQDDKVVGIFSERDLHSEVVAEERQPWEALVSEAVSSPVSIMHPDVDTDEAILMMARLGIERLPLLKEGELVGIITGSDIVDSLAELEEESSHPGRGRSASQFLRLLGLPQSATRAEGRGDMEQVRLLRTADLSI